MEMSSGLVGVLYPVADLRRTPGSLLRWWESRRLLYNAVVGGTGLITLSTLALIAAFPGGMGMPNPSGVTLGVIFYAVGANVCYSFGWVFEMLAKWAWGDKAPQIGPFLFREGLLFSVGLTLLPILIAVFASIVRLIL